MAATKQVLVPRNMFTCMRKSMPISRYSFAYCGGGGGGRGGGIGDDGCRGGDDGVGVAGGGGCCG